ncbi:MAG: S41 family peptidase [Gemmataceae bacterium]|nr:S41 family peptidase [Gemmataceae bacterium]
MSRHPLRLALASVLAVAAVLLLTARSSAAEVKLARHPDYHNGKIVFSYLGDLWLVSEDGSGPQRLTVHRGRDVHPRFSPDGKWIAFSSDRYGNTDVFVMPAAGGKAKRLTFHSSGDTVVGWSRDARKVTFSSSRGLMYPGIPNLYEVPVSGGLEQPILTDWGYWGSYSPDGNKLAFNRHPMTWWRKHYRGSYAADLWVLDVAKQSFKRIVDNDVPDDEKANNFWPMYGPEGWIYFVSDRDVRAKSGTLAVMKSTNNIWKVNEEGGDPVQVTKHKSGALFFPSMSADGKVIVYEENFGLWKLDVATGESREVKINIESDDQDNTLETVVINGEADSYYLSPSGKRAVVSVRGELFTIATDKGDIRRLTRTPSVREVQPQWSPDGKGIAFVSDKTGKEEVWLCDERGDKMKQISTGDSQKGQLRWSPSSKSLLYTATDNKLYRYDLDTGKMSVVVTSEVAAFGESSVGNPQWSPDGKWISYSKADRTLLPHTYIISAEGGPERRVTDSKSYSDALALWTADGKRLVYLAGLDVGNIGGRGQSIAQIYSVSLVRETADSQKGIDSEEEAQKAASTGPAGKIGKTPDGKLVLIVPKVEVRIDFKTIGRRARQLTRTEDSITSLTLSPDGKTVAFATSGIEGGRRVQSLWTLSVEGGQPKRVAQATPLTTEEGPPRRGAGGLGGFSSLQYAKDGRTLYFKQGSGIYAVTLGGGPAAAPAGGRPTAAAAPAGTPRRITFTARVEVDRQAQYRQVFHESWRVMKHRFYAADMHGVNWDKVRGVYEPLLAHVGDQEELHNVINQMIGELNASHTGISGRFGGRGEGASAVTRYPGFEAEADKSGYYKVKHVYKDGPADKDYVKVRVGDFILAVDGLLIKAGDNYWQHYTAAPGGRLEFLVNDQPALEGAWKARVTPVSSLQQATLQYEKWVEDRRAMVDRLTNGQFGYLHIRQMNEGALRRFERELAQLSTKKALIIDQRFNPGGNIDQELLQILGQRQYQVTQLRNSVKVSRPLRGFFAPMVVLANERSTSDAEVFPDGFRTLKLGKVVGVTTYGAVIGTGAYGLMDGSTIRTPSTGLWTLGGVNLENNGVRPDVYVDNPPEDLLRGRDTQLERAIAVLREELAQRK